MSLSKNNPFLIGKLGFLSSKTIKQDQIRPFELPDNHNLLEGELHVSNLKAQPPTDNQEGE